MKRTYKKLLLGTVGIITALGVTLGVVTTVGAHRTFEAPYPAIQASTDPELVERGRYLAYGPAHCVDCHGDPRRGDERKAGTEVPLSGGLEFHLPVGVFRAPNITPERATGIGARSDQELSRMLRHGVRPDGSAVLPFMPFANLTDRDLTAVLSFLRSQSPVKHEVPPHEFNVAGALVRALVLEPAGPSEPIRANIPEGPSVEYGRYLAHSVANCVSCHTKTNLATLSYEGPIFSGGAELESHSDPSQSFISPNLTPDPRSGWISDWSEDAFVARMQAGPVHEHSPMPWVAFRRLKDDDARALYRYLRSLPPAAGGPDPRDRRSVLTKNDG